MQAPEPTASRSLVVEQVRPPRRRRVPLRCSRSPPPQIPHMRQEVCAGQDWAAVAARLVSERFGESARTDNEDLKECVPACAAVVNCLRAYDLTATTPFAR